MRFLVRPSGAAPMPSTRAQAILNSWHFSLLRGEMDALHVLRTTDSRSFAHARYICVRLRIHDVHTARRTTLRSAYGAPHFPSHPSPVAGEKSNEQKIVYGRVHNATIGSEGPCATTSKQLASIVGHRVNFATFHEIIVKSLILHEISG